jgi:translocation and assembly module TamA
MGMFSAVVVEEGNAPVNGALPVRFVVTEKKPRRIGASLAVSSSDGVSATGFWRHRNLFGQAERLTVRASVEGIGNRPSLAALDYTLGVEFRKPGALAPDTDLVASTGIERSVVSTVETAVLEVDLGFARTRGTAIDTVSGFGAISQTTDTSGTRYFRLVGAKYGLIRDSRDDPLDPTLGRYVDLDLTGFHEFSFGNTGFRLAVDGRAYFSAGQSGRTVFALRGYFGSLIGVPIGASPGEYLFFSGGGGSVRGYQYHTRGVTIGGVFSGGLSVVNVSAEMRTKVSEKIGLVGFVDAGLVGQNSLPTAAGNLHVGLGVGLRYKTSFGPIRFDIAHGLNRVAGDPDFAIYVGLGQAF